MTVQDYPVRFGYLAQDGVWYGERGRIGQWHLGVDLFCPIGTPLYIAGTLVGQSGNTGNVEGPHCHIQAWIGSPTKGHVNPLPYMFKPGTVVDVGDNPNAQWGKYVTINANGVNVTYAHLSSINVIVGQVIGADDLIKDVDNEYNRINAVMVDIRGRGMSRDEFRRHIVGLTWLRAIEAIQDNPEAGQARHAQNVGLVAIRDNWEGQIHGLQSQLKTANEKISELAKNPTRETLEAAEAAVKACQEQAEKIEIVTPQIEPQTDSESSLLVKILAKIFKKNP